MNRKLLQRDVRLETVFPTRVVKHCGVTHPLSLKTKRIPSVSFHQENMVLFAEKGSFVLLDFGKELCGGLRFFVRQSTGMARFHIRFGESLTEAWTKIGDKGTGNEHAPRDFSVSVPLLSDLTFGQTGFRFALVESESDKPVLVQSIVAVNTLPLFATEAKIVTDDLRLNKILETAAYTLKLCLQNGFIWDGIKRDRLVWSGDMHQEILASLYLFGDNENIRNSLDFVAADTKATEWANWIPTYSAWWLLNLCDYVTFTGNSGYFKKHQAYAETVLRHIHSCIAEDGTMEFSDTRMPFFLDWPTFETDDAVIGTAAVILLAAKRYSACAAEYNCDADGIIRKLMPVVQNAIPQSKQVAAVSFLAGRSDENLPAFLQQNGAHGFSTFMAYYILKANALAGGQENLNLIREYFGAMLDKGATTFWEDFDLDWVENSGRIDAFPKRGQSDIHGDYGKYCYKNFRHSLCHGWSSGVVAFFVECIMGLHIENGKILSCNPQLSGLKWIHATLPLGGKSVKIDIEATQCNITYLK